MRLPLALAVLALCGSVVVCAQESGQAKAAEPRVPVAGGTVTGVVVCADTQRPARFANVRLIRKLTTEQSRIASLIGDNAMPKDVDPAAGQATGVAETLTSLDGSYRVENLQPGDYYVLAALPGYLAPVNPPSPLSGYEGIADQNKMLERVPLVHLAAGGAAVVNVSLEKAGTISGVVRYEDGSSAAGLRIAAHRVEEFTDPRPRLHPTTVPSIGFTPRWQTTDDEGRYRLSGLPPGKYKIRVTLMIEGHGQETVANETVPDTSGSLQELVMYAPHTQRVSEAEVIEIKGGESHAGTDLEVDLNGLHSVHGRLIAPDHHGITSAAVELTQGDGKDFSRYVNPDIDGSFHLDYIPEGTYTLTLNDIMDIVPESNGEGENVLQLYSKVVKTIIVTESTVDVGSIEAVPVKKAEEAPAQSGPQE